MAELRVFMAVLAAGASKRFGDKDKLAARFRGKRLGEHVCDTAPVELLPPACAYVIASAFDHPCEPAWREAGFGISLNLEAGRGMGTSVAQAARLAAKAECDALLIALADMPLVPREHFVALIDACRSSEDMICSHDGTGRMPPAIFGRERQRGFGPLTGDSGARSLLSEAVPIICPPEWLIDIDTPEALARHG